MGSFNAVCIVSGLPIEGGDKVRYLVLARSPFHPDGNDHVNYVSGRWKLFGIPVRAEYNDYGSVTKMEEGYAAGFLFAALRDHSVERGVGDNECHDLEVVADMGKKAWLKALWEGRVHVKECHPRSADGESTWEPTVGVPTFKRIKACLAAAGHPIQSRDEEEPYVEGFVVDDTSPGFVRVRPGGYGTELKVEDVLPALHKAGYAAMVVAGSGSYSRDSELLVGPLPPKDENVHIHVRPYGSDDDMPHTVATRPASQAMIREDVWQILLSLPGWSDRTVEDMRRDAISALEEAILEQEEDEEEPADQKEALGKLNEKLKRMLDRENKRETNFFREVVRDGRIGTIGFGLQDAFDSAVEAPDLDKAKAFVQEIAETAFAQFAFDSLGGQWQPRSNGGQDPNWEGHHGYLLRLADLAKDRAKSDRESDLPDDDKPDDDED